MKKFLIVLMSTAVCLFLTHLFAQEFTYVGSAKCKICHRTDKQGKQFPIWEESGHSKSFQTLTSDEAKALQADAHDNPQCLKCHAPLAEKAADLKEEGVTCEICHGPGSAYKSLTVMKNRDESVAKGLITYASEDAIKNQCLTCHENAHDKPFDFAAAWEKIKHNKPDEESF
jgi:hypothetical protein